MEQTFASMRARKRYSVSDVAYLAKLNPSTVWRIERGLVKPKPETIRVLAEVLGVQTARMAAVIGNGKP